MATMRAIVVHNYGDPELKLNDVPIPTVGPNQVLIKVVSAGVNPIDTYIRQGDYTTPFGVTLPYTPGYDAAGLVHKIGSGVTKFQEGDRVYTGMLLVTGSYAEYTLAEESHVQPLPERLSFAQGASLGIPYHTAYRALVIIAKAEASDTILVHGGSGAVGIAIIQMAKSFGLKVIATAGTEDGLLLARKMGADLTFSHRKEGYTSNILESTDGKGVDIIMEMLANVNLDKDLTLLKRKGRVVVIGCRGDVQISPKVIMSKECVVTGITLPYNTAFEWASADSLIQEGIQKGWVTPLVGKEYKLEDAAQAHRDIIVNRGTLGKLVLKI